MFDDIQKKKYNNSSGSCLPHNLLIVETACLKHFLQGKDTSLCLL